MLRPGTLTTWAALIAGACVSFAHAPLVHAQSDGGFFIESIAQESVAPDRVDGLSSSLVSNPNEYKIDLTLSSGLSLYHAFDRNEMTINDLAFGTGITEQMNTGGTLTLGSRTSMNFSREETSLSDVFQQFQEGETLTTMALSQGFGGGSSSGQFTLSRSLQSERAADEEELRTLIQSMAFGTGLGEGASFAAGFTTRESQIGRAHV